MLRVFEKQTKFRNNEGSGFRRFHEFLVCFFCFITYLIKRDWIFVETKV